MTHQRCQRVCQLVLFLSMMLVGPFAWVHPASAQNALDPVSNGLTIHVNLTSVSLMEGEYFTFSTNISNNGTETTPSLVAHLNVGSLKKGIYVDPEDWSSERTLFLEPLGPGASVNLTWRVHALFAGDIAVYVVVLPMDAASTPAVSDEVIVHVEKWSVMYLSDVTPVVIAVPVVLGTLYIGLRGLIVHRSRRHRGRNGSR